MRVLLISSPDLTGRQLGRAKDFQRHPSPASFERWSVASRQYIFTLSAAWHKLWNRCRRCPAIDEDQGSDRGPGIQRSAVFNRAVDARLARVDIDNWIVAELFHLFCDFLLPIWPETVGSSAVLFFGRIHRLPVTPQAVLGLIEA
jgi:hypothetical protein